MHSYDKIFEDKIALKTDEVTKMPLPAFCISCLEKQTAYISLQTCSHADFLNNHPIIQINPENLVICYLCHDMLKKIKTFKLQVDESYKLLSSQETKSEAIYRKPILQVHKMENIDITDNLKDNNIIVLENTITSPNSNTENSTTGNTNTNNSTIARNLPEETTKSSKLKNIENALKIINSNQNDACMNFLAASLQNISQSLLSDSLNNMKLLGKNLTGLSQRNNLIVDTTKLKLDSAQNNFSTKNDILKNTFPMKDNNAFKIARNRFKKSKTSLPPKINKITLTRDELLGLRLETANSQTYVNSLYRCENCLVGFFYAENLEDHINRKHSPKEGTINCDVCFQSLYPGPNYDDHVLRHYTRYGCLECGRRFFSYEVAVFHFKRRHCQSVIYKCKNCPYITPIKNDLRNHFKSHRIRKITSVKRNKMNMAKII